MNWTGRFIYEASTGWLIALARPYDEFKSQWAAMRWNKRFANKSYGIKRTSYSGRRKGVFVEMGGYRYPAHRIIWEMHYGAIPEGMVIDHIDGDAWNNMLSNLRLCTPTQNAMNNTQPVRSATGLKGVSKVGRKYRASISHGGRVVHLGWFLNPEEAHAAYVDASRTMRGEFCPYRELPLA